MANRYEILDLLATGGMAEIYRARSIGAGGFQKPVVVKKILPSFTSDPEFVEMFIEEAKLAAELHHGNIVQVYDLGTTGSGEYFIVMELVHGHDLGDLLHDAARRSLTFGLGEAIYIARQVCAGLDYAHRKLDSDGRPLGIVHRDVSPQNVLISFEGEVKLTDFGIAKARTRTQQTQVGFLKGKYGYMSPEQARGERLDQRSDLFNVGILLYEILVGERLFKGSNDFSTLNQMRNVEMVPIERLREDLPESLVGIVHQTLSAEPENRFQSAAELDKALARLSFEHSLVMSGGDLSHLMVTVYGRPASSPGKLTATRVIDLEGLPGADLLSAGGSEVGVEAPAGGWPEDPPVQERKKSPGTGPRPPTVSIQPARATRLPPRPVTRFTRIIPPLPPWARGSATLALAALTFGVGLLLAWPWGGSAASDLLPLGGLPSSEAAEAGTGAQAPSADPEARWLLVRSRPDQAAVTLGGVRRARATPALLRVEAGQGATSLQLTRAGNRPWKQKVKIPGTGEGDDQEIGEVEARLEVRTIPVKIRTRPSRASLFLGGKPVGQSPKTLSLPPGIHRLTARKRGYLRAVAEIEPTRSRRVEFALPQKGKTGKVRVLTYPAATVRVGGRVLEAGAEGALVELPAGLHRLEVEATPLPPRKMEVEVVQGVTTRVFVDLMLSSARHDRP